MTDQEAKAIATVIAGSQIIEHDGPHSPQFSAAERKRIQAKMLELGEELLARYGRDHPVGTEFEAKRYILEEYYG